MVKVFSTALTRKSFQSLCTKLPLLFSCVSSV